MIKKKLLYIHVYVPNTTCMLSYLLLTVSFSIRNWVKKITSVYTCKTMDRGKANSC